MNTYSMLFSKGNIGNLEIRNRTVMTAMGVDVSDPDGSVNEKTIAYYTERAKGGIGLIVTEYCRVNEKDGACATGQISLSNDKYIEGMRRLTESVHKEGAKIFIQLHHPGRQSVPIFPSYWSKMEKIAKVWPGVYDKFYEISSNSSLDTSDPEAVEQLKKMQKTMSPVLAPSIIPAEEDESQLTAVKTRAFTTKEVEKLRDQFIAAAVRAKKAGADGVELHGAHGYLIQQFFSPYTNRRDDKYGGSFENRMRFAKEIIQGIKKECGVEFPVMVRMTMDEMNQYKGHNDWGYHLDEGIRIAKAMEEYGADALDLSIASYVSSELVIESIRYAPGWRADMVAAVKKKVNIPVAAVGVIRDPVQAEELLENGTQDFIGLGRPTLADPYWARKAEEGKADQINRCISCLACRDSFMANMLNDLPIECALNPRTCHETEYEVTGLKNGRNRTVLVIGSGPAGLMAARELAQRQFKVTVIEKEDTCGGQINLADKPPFKERLIWCVEDLKAQAEAAGAEIVLNTTADRELVESYNPYAVILAAGAYASKPRISGAEADFVTTVDPILTGEIRYEDKDVIVVGSGMTGLETAEMIMKQGNRVKIVEMADKIASGASGTNINEAVHELKAGNTEFYTGHKLLRIEDHQIVTEDKEGTEETMKADAVVLSLGSRKNDALKEELKDGTWKLVSVGDCEKVGRIGDAARSAFIAARTL